MTILSYPGRRARAPSTILVVDDEPSMREVLKRLLEDEGLRVVVAANAAEARAASRDPDRPLDLVIIDLMLPETTGDAVAAEVTARCPGLPVLFLTGLFDLPDRLAAGVDFHWELLHKPVWPERIVAQVKSMLGRRPSPRPRHSSRGSVGGPAPEPRR